MKLNLNMYYFVDLSQYTERKKWSATFSIFMWFNSLEKILLWIFPDSSIGKEPACNAGDPDLIPGSGRSPGEGNATHPLQYTSLENSVNTGAWSLEGYNPWSLKESDMTEQLYIYRERLYIYKYMLLSC